MQPVYFVMMILGCGDGNVACVDARVNPVHFATAAECRAQLADGIARNTDLSFPVIAADCRRNTPLTIARAGKSPARG